MTTTPLHNAIIGGYTEVVRLLLDKGANIEALDKEVSGEIH